MPRVLHIAAVKNADDITTLNVFDGDGAPVDLDSEGATAVKIEVCGALHNATIGAENFGGNTIQVKFGSLQLPPGSYRPKIYYTTAAAPNGITLAADGFATSIQLQMGC